MSASSAIEWTDATWNPVVGCTKVSPGCRNCYAEALHDKRHKAHREGKAVPPQYAERFSVVQLMHDRLTDPLGWRRPRRVFVNSVSDLFHEDVPFGFIDRVFAAMALASQHTFQVLTKRAERMAAYVASWTDYQCPQCADYGQKCTHDRRPAVAHRVAAACGAMAYPMSCAAEVNAAMLRGPLPNVWLGVSVEDQRRADERIPHLLRTPAAVRFLSGEPLLGPLDLFRAEQRRHWLHARGDHPDEPTVDWVIVGGESGPGSRPMREQWAASIRDQCQAAGVAFFFKQWGDWIPGVNFGRSEGNYNETPVGTWPESKHETHRWDEDEYGQPEEEVSVRIGKKAAGRLLDGRTWDEFPEHAGASA